MTHASGPAPAAPTGASLSPASAGADARLAVVGMSIRATCGVRDHATLLAAALERDGHPVSMHWLTRQQLPLRAASSEVRAWCAQLAGQLRDRRADAVLLHYSPFSYAYRGVPLFVRPSLRALDSAELPILCMAHELAYPWRREGLRGRLWAITQRVALRQLLRSSAGVIVTADFQRDWLTSSRWLPARPTLMAPVFSNLPAPLARHDGGHEQARIGLFGYAYQGSEMAVVLDALALLRAREVSFRLALLGAPGRNSSAAEEWLAAGRERDVGDRLEFRGPLPAQELSDELACCDVLVSCARLGPSSRKGTLAGALASGAPVVALDGPLRWRELVQAEAVLVVAPTAQALAGALQALLADERQRKALGARGRAFAESHMGIGRTKDAVLALLAQAAAPTGRGGDT